MSDHFAVAAFFIDNDRSSPGFGLLDSSTWATSDDVGGYDAIINYSVYGKATRAQKYDTILHEMAHFLDTKGFNQNDGLSPSGEDANEKLLQQNCGKTINGSH